MTNKVYSFLLLFLTVLLLTGCITVSAPINLFEPKLPVLVEKYYLYDEDVEDKILVIPISGEISLSSDRTVLSRKTNTVEGIKRIVDNAKADKNIKGIILKINSPGGEVTATDLVFYELMKLKAIKQVPVVAWCYGTAASGGYYIAMISDEIYASPTTTIGSIGVISTFPYVGGLLKKVGVKIRVVKTGKSKDAGSMYKKMSKSDKKRFRQLIDAAYQRFVGVVIKNRSKKGVSKNDIMKLADGRVYSAEDSLKHKLVDKIGYFDHVIAYLKNVTKLKKFNIYSYTDQPTKNINQYSSDNKMNENIIPKSGLTDVDSLKKELSPKFLYLWLP